MNEIPSPRDGNPVLENDRTGSFLRMYDCEVLRSSPSAAEIERYDLCVVFKLLVKFYTEVSFL